MPMDRNSFLNAIVDDGVYEITISYTKPNQTNKRDGGIAGFEACRGKSDEEILALFESSKHTTRVARDNQASDYWYHRMYELQVEWVLNVLSAAYHTHGAEILIPVTARGLQKAANILNT